MPLLQWYAVAQQTPTTMEQYREPTTRDDRQHVLQLASELMAAVQRLTGTPERPPQEAAVPPEPAIKLPKRCLEFLRLLCDPKGYTYKEIAAKMNCHTSTLRTYRERIAKKHGIKGKGNLIRWAVGKGLV